MWLCRLIDDESSSEDDNDISDDGVKVAAVPHDECHEREMNCNSVLDSPLTSHNASRETFTNKRDYYFW